MSRKINIFVANFHWNKNGRFGLITHINTNALSLVLRHTLGLILGDRNSLLFNLRVEYNLKMGTI